MPGLAEPVRGRGLEPGLSFPSDWTADVHEVGVIGVVESTLRDAGQAPLQADEGAPPARLRFRGWAEPALEGMAVGAEILVLTWLHLADRHRLQVHPRGDARNPVSGVFATRSPHRPNPIGIHRTRIVELGRGWLEVSSLEAVDGTPIIDVKAVLDADDR